MIFSKEDGRIIATINEDGCENTYECLVEACANPLCVCGELHLNFIPATKEDAFSECEITLNAIEGKAIFDDNDKNYKDNKAFIESFFSGLTAEDHRFLKDLYSESKNEITEKTSPDAIDCDFSGLDIEGGLMIGYNEMLPYGKRLNIKTDKSSYMLLDQYCIRPKCGCVEAIASVMTLDPSGETAEELCSFGINYKSNKWSKKDIFLRQLDLSEIRIAAEEQIPNFYAILEDRHQKLKSIYKRWKKETSQLKLRKRKKTGRNDPCPCGSGKKYKKCCLNSKTGMPLPPEADNLILKDKPPAASLEQVYMEVKELDDLSNSIVDLLRKDCIEEAEKACERLLRDYPEVIDGWERLGMVRAAQERYLEAAQCYRRVVDSMRKDKYSEEEAIDWVIGEAEKFEAMHNERKSNAQA